jgi:outer membrane beta-barrel protein
MIRKPVLWVLTGLVLAFSGLATNSARADDPPEEYNFRWLDPDKKIYVLQNRKYEKARRFLFTAMAGATISTPYRDSITVHPRAAFYFTEWIGVEVLFNYTFNWENSTLGALQSSVGASGVLPVTRQLQLQYGALVHWVPWYAKINVFNNILYFDWYFSAGPGASQVQRDTRASAQAAATYTNETYFTVFLGTGHQYHLNHWLTIRFDFTASLYPAPPIVGSNSWNLFPNYSFSTGVGFRL